jgi:hypothetical protein
VGAGVSSVNSGAANGRARARAVTGQDEDAAENTEELEDLPF